MQSRQRLALNISLAVFGIAVVASVLSAPDTLNGAPIPGYMWIRLAACGFIAVLCFLGCLLGFRIGNTDRLSLLRGVVIVALYTVLIYFPSFHASVTMDHSGRILRSTGAWWSLAAPFVLPFVLALIVPKFPLKK